MLRELIGHLADLILQTLLQLIDQSLNLLSLHSSGSVILRSLLWRALLFEHPFYLLNLLFK
jgi:hypothetical protein